MTDQLIASLSEPLLVTIDRLPEYHPLTAKQVGLILDCSIRWLEEQRAKGNPPPWYALNDRMIRYAAGPFRDYLKALMAQPVKTTSERTKAKAERIAGLDEPLKSRHRTFSSFVTTGLLADVWPFALVGPHQRPLDFIETLAVDLDDSVDCVYLTLQEFISKTQRCAQLDTAEHERRGLEETLPHAPPGQKGPHTRGL